MKNEKYCVVIKELSIDEAVDLSYKFRTRATIKGQKNKKTHKTL
jgi:hypothetical protein